ncbi:cytochrome P450 6k1-like [Schistocerca piceifrons]|uniref:cytochrome P450 6k1-like n=1 Tax=Schistocerca piceifrons TaxID=274613 RepID=UPI001F5FCB1C|nr:cytochrome P450 6k1-like [Schistocerca piceifrons]
MEAAGMTSLWLSAATLAALLCWWLVRQSHSYWQQRGVACPLRPHPLLGHLQNLALLRESARDLLQRVYDAGQGIPYVGMYFMHKPALMVRDPELVQRVLVSEFASFPDRHARTGQFRDPLGHANLFLMRSPRWRVLRSKLSPAFTSGHLRRMAPIVDRCADQLLGLLQGAVDVREIMARFTTDVISNCAFGVNSNAMGDPKSPFRAFGRKIFEFTRARGTEINGIFYTPWLSDILGFSFFQSETSKFLRNSLWQVIRGREQSGEKRSDFVELLIQLKNKGVISPAGEEKDGSNVEAKDKGLFDFEGDDLVAQASVFFSAGFETTGSALTFMMYELAHNPEVQERLRAEVLEALAKAPQGPLTYDTVADIRYLNMCIAETLRKYPPLPQLDRECVRTCDSLVPGLRIEKGTPIVVPVMAMHYDPELFPEPDRYDPERFAPEVVGKGPKGYLPFGDGPRICIGTRFAQMVMRLALVKIISSGVQVLPAEDTPTPPLRFNKYSFMTGTVGGIPLCFKRAPDAA